MLNLLDVKGGCGAFHVLRHSTMCKLFFQSFAQFFHVLDIIACCLDTGSFHALRRSGNSNSQRCGHESRNEYELRRDAQSAGEQGRPRSGTCKGPEQMISGINDLSVGCSVS